MKALGAFTGVIQSTSVCHSIYICVSFNLHLYVIMSFNLYSSFPFACPQVQIIQDPSGGGQTIQIVDDPDGDGQQIVLQEEDDDEFDEKETKFAIAQAAAAAAGGSAEQSVILNAGNTYQVGG